MIDGGSSRRAQRDAFATRTLTSNPTGVACRKSSPAADKSERYSSERALAPSSEDEHVDVVRLRGRRRVAVRDNGLDDEHPAVAEPSRPAVSKNAHRAIIVPVVQDELQDVGRSAARNALEEVPAAPDRHGRLRAPSQARDRIEERQLRLAGARSRSGAPAPPLRPPRRRSVRTARDPPSQRRAVEHRKPLLHAVEHRRRHPGGPSARFRRIPSHARRRRQLGRCARYAAAGPTPASAGDDRRDAPRVRGSRDGPISMSPRAASTRIGSAQLHAACRYSPGPAADERGSRHGTESPPPGRRRSSDRLPAGRRCGARPSRKDTVRTNIRSADEASLLQDGRTSPPLRDHAIE